MNAAVKEAMGNDLRLGFAALSQQETEQVSGGTGKTNEATPGQILETLLIIARSWMNLYHFVIFEEFWRSVSIERAMEVEFQISALNKEVYSEYLKWTSEERKSAWKVVWSHLDK